MAEGEIVKNGLVAAGDVVKEKIQFVEIQTINQLKKLLHVRNALKRILLSEGTVC